MAEEDLITGLSAVVGGAERTRVMDVEMVVLNWLSETCGSPAILCSWRLDQ